MESTGLRLNSKYTYSATSDHAEAPVVAPSQALGLALPLSWHYRAVSQPQMTSVHLPLSGLEWIAYADLPFGYSFEQFFSDYLARLPHGFLIRGCSPQTMQFLAEHGCDTLRNGVEAVIDLDGPGLQRKSVIKLAKRARPYGSVHEVSWSETAAHRLQAFAQKTRYGQRPQLRHLFRTRFERGMRLFAFCTPTGAWHAALLVARPIAGTAVTELMLRGSNAPAGVMENLLVTVGRQLRLEGVGSLSLNEVPFYHFVNDLRWQERIVGTIGRGLRWAYNATGLLHFKAKFAPTWRPISICASPHLPWVALADMFVVSGCMSLVRHQLIHSVDKSHRHLHYEPSVS